MRELFDLGVHQQSLMPSMENAAQIYSYVHKLYAEMDAASIVLSPSMMEFLEESMPDADDSGG